MHIYYLPRYQPRLNGSHATVSVPVLLVTSLNVEATAVPRVVHATTVRNSVLTWPSVNAVPVRVIAYPTAVELIVSKS